MPVQLFTEAERARRNRFPDVIAYEDLVTFFTLSERDRASIPRSREPHNHLGYALQLCTLRFMGFVPDDLSSVPPDAVGFVADQLAIEPHVLAAYGGRAQTRQDHLLTAQTHLGYRKVDQDDLHALAAWLLDRALEHDKPTLLYTYCMLLSRSLSCTAISMTSNEHLVWRGHSKEAKR
jgi:TnpA family transposase